MIKRLLLPTLLAAAGLLSAQTPCPPPECACLELAAKNAAVRNDYVDAIRQYNAAAACDPDSAPAFNARIEELFRQIDALRLDAEQKRAAARKTESEVVAAARRAARTATDMQKQSAEADSLRREADSLALVAEAEWKNALEKQKAAEAEEARTRQALAELQAVFGDITDIYLQQAADSIHALRYDAAWYLAREAAFLHVPDRLPAVGALSFELAYVFNESREKDRLPALLDSLRARRPALPARPDTAGDCRAAVRAWLLQADSAAFAAWERRYYPTLMPISGGTFMMGTDEKDKDNLVKELLEQYKDLIDQKEAEDIIGDELPRHEVSLDDFQMAQTETTWYQYGLYCRARQIDLPDEPSWGIRGDHPAVNVSWEDAQGYLAWLNTQSGGGYRLPTEAEWEYAAKGGQPGLKDDFRYAGSNDLNRVGWYADNAGGTTKPVAQKRSNQLGLYDMSGNVWEWCADWYGPYAAGPAKNPKGPEKGEYAVLRGGSWVSYAFNFRSASRLRLNPGIYWNNFIGFRSARDGR